jgi:hypothetical protein
VSERLYARRSVSTVSAGDVVLHYNEKRDVTVESIKYSNEYVSAGFSWPEWSKFYGSWGTLVWRPEETVWVYVCDNPARR